MRIYICIPETVFNDNDKLENLRSELHGALINFYGYFQPSDIKFFKSSDHTSKIFIMEEALKTKSDDAIMEAIEGIFKAPVDIKLNYQKLNPDFMPVKPKPQTPAPEEKENTKESSEFDYEKLSLNYHAEEPHYNFDQVILPKETREKIEDAVATIKVEKKVFDEWGLRSIIPYAASAMSFYGAPGTGKTMAAEAVANMLGKKIIRAAYADIESKYHGEGPKMVKAIFLAAQREDAVLFLDESDSLLSKRLTDVRSGSEQAINSMRSQLLISLEHFRGIVIFATNLVVNYDQAFLSRLISIEFPNPDFEARCAIWNRHIRGEGLNIPLSNDVNIEELAKKYEFCGRDIKNAVKDACVVCAVKEFEVVSQDDLIKACEKVKEELEALSKASDHTQSKLKVLMQKKAQEVTAQEAIKEEKTPPSP